MPAIPEIRVARIALERHYIHALDQGGLLVALSRCRVADREPLHSLRDRQQAQLIDVLHEFCYNARRAIELAEEYAPGIIAHAKMMKLAGFGETQVHLDITEDAKPLADQSLWWILGRVIHSRELSIHDQDEIEVGTKWAAAPNMTGYSTPIAFTVQSDFDGPDERHWVLTEHIVERFLSLEEKFEQALQAARAQATGC